MVSFPVSYHGSCQAKIDLVPLNLCRSVLRPTGSFFELGHIRAKHVLHRRLHPGTERTALRNHQRQVHPVGKAGEEIAPGLIGTSG